MAMQYAPNKLSVPPGWEQLLSDFAREMLRSQPADVYKFAVEHFKVKAKKESEAAAAGAEGDGEIDIDLTDPATEEAAVMIQKSFRGYQARKDGGGGGGGDGDAAAAVVPEPEEAASAPTGAEEEPIDIDLTDPATEEAAVMIQKSFRGYQVRKEGGGDAPAAVAQETEEEVKARAVAATKIQAQFRGHSVRKNKNDKPFNKDEVSQLVIKLKELFTSADGKRDASLNKNELKFRLNREALTDMLIEVGVLDKFDTDGDGKVSADEIMATMDVDGDKTVSIDEFISSVMKLLEVQDVNHALNAVTSAVLEEQQDAAAPSEQGAVQEAADGVAFEVDMSPPAADDAKVDAAAAEPSAEATADEPAAASTDAVTDAPAEVAAEPTSDEAEAPAEPPAEATSDDPAAEANADEPTEAASDTAEAPAEPAGEATADEPPADPAAEAKPDEPAAEAAAEPAAEAKADEASA